MIDPRPRDQHYATRLVRRMNLGAVDGRSDSAAPSPTVPLPGQEQPPLGIHLGIVNKGNGPATGASTNPFPIPMAGQILAVELFQLGTMTVDATFRVAVNGAVVGPTITLPLGTGTSVYLPALFTAVVPPGYVQLACIAGGNGMANLGGYILLVP